MNDLWLHSFRSSWSPTLWHPRNFVYIYIDDCKSEWHSCLRVSIASLDLHSSFLPRGCVAERQVSLYPYRYPPPLSLCWNTSDKWIIWISKRILPRPDPDCRPLPVIHVWLLHFSLVKFESMWCYDPISRLGYVPRPSTRPKVMIPFDRYISTPREVNLLLNAVAIELLITGCVMIKGRWKEKMWLAEKREICPWCTRDKGPCWTNCDWSVEKVPGLICLDSRRLLYKEKRCIGYRRVSKQVAPRRWFNNPYSTVRGVRIGPRKEYIMHRTNRRATFQIGFFACNGCVMKDRKGGNGFLDIGEVRT